MDDTIKSCGTIADLADRTIKEVRANASSKLEMAAFRRDVFRKAKHWKLNGNEFVGSLISMAIVSMKEMGLSNEDVLTVVKRSPQFLEETKPEEPKNEQQ